MSQNIVRTSTRDDPFARIPHTLLDDERLSWRAKGILCYLVGKPSGWKTRVKDLQNRAQEGRDAVRSALDELRALGYAEFVPARGVGGAFEESTWKIADSPIYTPFVKSPRTEKPDAVKPESGFQGHSKKVVKKNECSKNEVSTGESERDASESSKVFDALAPDFSAKWIPDERSKSEKLKTIRPPKRGEYPSQFEFLEFIETEQLDNIGMGKRDPEEIYSTLCNHKWREWRGTRWKKIYDWKAYIRGLEQKIETATTGGF